MGRTRAAVGLLRTAADLARGDPLELGFLDSLHLAHGDWSEDVALVVARLADAARALDDPVYTMRARHLALVLRFFREPETYDAAGFAALLDEALRTYRTFGATGLATRALRPLAELEWIRSGAAAGVERANEALAAAVELGDRLQIAWCVTTLIGMLAFGPAPLSVASARASEVLATFAGDRMIEGVTLGERAFVHALSGRPDRARADVTAYRAICDDLAWRGEPEVLLPWIAGVVGWSQGDLPGAERSLRAAIMVMEERGDRFNTGSIALPMARLLLDLGRNDEAEAVVAQHRNDRVPEDAASACSLAGVLAARRAALDEAIRLSDEALATTAGKGYLVLQADVSLDRAEILHLAGRPDEARASAADALAKHERKEYAIGIRRAREMLERLGR